MMFLALADLGLQRIPPVYKDRMWWWLAAAGLAAGPILWLLVGINPIATVPHGFWQWAGVIGWQPFVEELLFRGLLQGQLLRLSWARRTWHGISAANGMASLVFTAIHFLYHPPLWAVAVLLPSLIFGWLRERHQSTWSPLIMHVLYNLGFFLSAALAA